MKILVLSDTHGAVWYLDEILSREKDCSVCIFLGDGVRDLESYFPRPGVSLVAVRGNCDPFSALPLRLIVEAGGKTLFLTHGHSLHVSPDLLELNEAVHDAGAQIGLFGHTHEPLQDRVDDVLLFNPGSVDDGDYAVLEITPQDVIWLPKRVD